jgi:hypothetical protein
MAVCPHCFRQAPAQLSTSFEQLPYSQPPELVLPFTVSSEVLADRIRTFAGHIYFAPVDLEPQQLLARLQRLYLPHWLVDVQVQALWRAEAGFNYEVVSHRDEYDQRQGGWRSDEITETRINWEPRLGRLTRTYHNIDAPALEEDAVLQRRLGRFDLATAQPYKVQDTVGAIIRLPNRPPTDAWPEAVPALRHRAAEECRRAATANHLREFQWSADYDNLNWTQLLLPVLTTYYLDDDGNPQPLLIHGQTGQIFGSRRASPKRARQTALVIALVGLATFILSLFTALGAFFEPSLGMVAGIGIVLSMLILLAAIVPIVIVWEFIRSHPDVASV